VPDDDPVLIARARHGDLDAFDALVRVHQDRVYHLAYRVTGNHEDAADAAQDAFVRAYQALPRFRGDAAFSTWLHRIATNAALDLIRRRPAHAPVDLSLADRGPGGPEHEADRRETGRRVHAALAQIPAEFRVAVVLRDLQGFDYEEIARILAVPVGTVRSRISRGREALRTRLSDLVTSEG
jgi:RNA polymerase sigma-70 factor (ECF subfamily)